MTATRRDSQNLTSAHATRRGTGAVAAWAALIAVAAWAPLANAQDAPLTPADRQEARVDARQDRQSDRLDQGVAAGEITRIEKARLEREQRHINRLERRTEADGSVSRREALRVEKAQDRASRHIARASHDRQSRPRAN